MKSIATFKNSLVPTGYQVREVKRWGDPVMVEDGHFDTNQRGDVGQFGVVEMHITDAYGAWSGTWGAVSQFSTLTHADVMKLANTQLLDFGYRWGMTDAQIIGALDQRLSDNSTLRQKMNWLIYQDWNGGATISPMWCRGLFWKAPEVYYGCQVWAGQKIAVSNGVEYITTKLPGANISENIAMRKVVTFQRADWGTTYTKEPWKMVRATVFNDMGEGDKGNHYGENPRGKIMVPNALDPRHVQFGFPGNFEAVYFRIPDRWLK